MKPKIEAEPVSDKKNEHDQFIHQPDLFILTFFCSRPKEIKGRWFRKFFLEQSGGEQNQTLDES